jgi:hypothetical protein
MDGGYHFASGLVTGMRVFTSAFTIVVLAGKIAADLNKHKNHEAHHQLCDCLGVCYVCIWENARSQAFQKKVSKV